MHLIEIKTASNQLPPSTLTREQAYNYCTYSILDEV